MKIIFIYQGSESLGVEYLAAGARAAGHEVGLLFDPAVFGGHVMWDFPTLARIFDKRPQIIKRIVSEQPDVVAFSCVGANYKWALSIANEVKRQAPGIRTIFGGSHITAVPHVVIMESSVDALITGEADESFPALMSDWERGVDNKRPGTWEKRDGEIIRGADAKPVTDMDALPIPAKDIYYDKIAAFEHNYIIIAARGCPHNCTYCFKEVPFGRRSGVKAIRRRSVGSVITELEGVAERGRAKLVVFRDDVFTINKPWLEEFTKKYRDKIGIPYFCNSHPLNLDAYRADMLRESGCVYVTVGVQSVDEGQRRNVLKRRYTNDAIRKTIGLLKERDIMVSVDHILGLPGDTREMCEEAALFYNELRPHRLLTYWLTYFPGTEILKMARELGIQDDEDVKHVENGEASCLYGGVGDARDIATFRKFMVLFPFILLLPRSWVKTIIKKKLYERFPGASMATNLAIVINAIRIRDPFFLYNLRFLLSFKKAP